MTKIQQIMELVKNYGELTNKRGKKKPSKDETELLAMIEQVLNIQIKS